MKLFVGNLSYDMTEDELQNLFSEYGEVLSAKIISDRFTGQSKGFAFVEMASRDAGEAAISALHEQMNNGRKLVVNEARQQEGRRPGNSGGGNFQNRRSGYNRR